MLFHISYVPRAGADARVALGRFTKWTPPAGLEFKSHHASGNGWGGFAIVETTSAALIIEATVTFADVLDFEVKPVLDINEAVPIQMKANAWIDSLSS